MLLLFTTNSFLRNGFSHLHFDDSRFRCKYSVVVFDATQSGSLQGIRKINVANVCALIILVENECERTLFQYITPPCWVFYISLKHPIDVIEYKVSEIFHSLVTKVSCRYSFYNPIITNRVSLKEFEAVRLFFSGESTHYIAELLSIGNRTVLNYVKRAMIKLELKFSIETYHLFNNYNVLEDFCTVSKDIPIGDGHCPLRVNYIKACC